MSTLKTTKYVQEGGMTITILDNRQKIIELYQTWHVIRGFSSYSWFSNILLLKLELLNPPSHFIPLKLFVTKGSNKVRLNRFGPQTSGPIVSYDDIYLRSKLLIFCARSKLKISWKPSYICHDKLSFIWVKYVFKICYPGLNPLVVSIKSI